MKAQNRRTGFSLIEMLVAVAVIVALAAILIPTTHTILVNARQAKGANQLRQLGVALQCYSQENKQTYPPVAVDSVPWDRQALQAYLGVYGSNTIPALDGGGNAESTDDWKVRRAYSAGGGMFGLTKWNEAVNTSIPRSVLTIENLNDAVLLFDARVTWHGLCRDGTNWSRFSSDVENASVDGNKYIDYRHNGEAQFLFADMHVEAMTPGDVAAKFTDRKIYEGTK
ncbi:prepilin-type N-terminal cleavage/methylation domain-containing protein [Puniceicoccus vermicola]|nr:prepilin-type N-terminal cleavage/methylation domain-containing protein [Puniceicoccus vermicola]